MLQFYQSFLVTVEVFEIIQTHFLPPLTSPSVLPQGRLARTIKMPTQLAVPSRHRFKILWGFLNTDHRYCGLIIGADAQTGGGYYQLPWKLSVSRNVNDVK